MASIPPHSIPWRRNEHLKALENGRENIKRRHLTKSQIAMVAAGVMDYLVEDAKRRQVEAGKTTHSNQHKKAQLVELVPQAAKTDEGTRAREQAGKLFDVSGWSIGDAQMKALKSGSPNPGVIL